MCDCKRTPCVHSFQSFVRAAVPAAQPSDEVLLAALEKRWDRAAAPVKRDPDAELLASLEDGWGDPGNVEAAPPKDHASAPSRAARDPDEDRLPTPSDHEAIKRLLELPHESRRTITIQADEEETPFLLMLRKGLRPRQARTLEPAHDERR